MLGLDTVIFAIIHVKLQLSDLPIYGLYFHVFRCWITLKCDHKTFKPVCIQLLWHVGRLYPISTEIFDSTCKRQSAASHWSRTIAHPAATRYINQQCIRQHKQTWSLATQRIQSVIGTTWARQYCYITIQNCPHYSLSYGTRSVSHKMGGDKFTVYANQLRLKK